MDPGEPLLDLVQRLRAVTLEQVLRARALDGKGLLDLGVSRDDLLFELRVALADPPELDAAARAHLRTEVEALQAVEARLARVTGIVAQALSAARLDGTAGTYGRTGTLGVE